MGHNVIQFINKSGLVSCTSALPQTLTLSSCFLKDYEPGKARVDTSFLGWLISRVAEGCERITCLAGHFAAIQ